MSREVSLLFRTFSLQLFLSIAAAAIWFYTKSPVAGYSSIVGGSIHFVPYLVSSFVILAHKAHSDNAFQLVMDAYCGVGVKFVLTIIMFVSCFLYMQEAVPVPLFTTFALSAVTQGIVSFVYNNRY